MKELYRIIEDERETLDVTVSCYMLELYNDQLVDLLAEKDPKNHNQEKKGNLAIKLDAKGVVVVQVALKFKPKP